MPNTTVYDKRLRFKEGTDKKGLSFNEFQDIHYIVRNQLQADSLKVNGFTTLTFSLGIFELNRLSKKQLLMHLRREFES